jgi:hypothetical protein
VKVYTNLGVAPQPVSTPSGSAAAIAKHVDKLACTSPLLAVSCRGAKSPGPVTKFCRVRARAYLLKLWKR